MNRLPLLALLLPIVALCLACPKTTPSASRAVPSVGEPVTTLPTGSAGRTTPADAGLALQPSVEATSGDAQALGAPATALGTGGNAVAATLPPDDPRINFLENRLRRAKAGTAEIVSMRLWHCGPSCTCPQPCLETVVSTFPMTWVDLVDRAGKAVPVADWANVDVAGSFTGRVRQGKGPAPESYAIPEFRLIGAPRLVNTAMSPEIEDAEAKVLLAGALAEKVVPKASTDRPFVVVAGAFSRAIPADPARTDADALGLFQKLQGLGFAEAERFDSRAFDTFACCFEVVTAGRFADAKSAEERQRAILAKGIKGYVKKGF